MRRPPITKNGSHKGADPCQCGRLPFPHRWSWHCDAYYDCALGATNLDEADAEEMRYIHGQDTRAINGGLL